MPVFLSKFQELKYDKNKRSEYEKLQDNFQVKSNIKTGKWGSKINEKKQAPHNELTRENGKSFLFKDVRAQDLFDRCAGTGELLKTLNGKKSNKEICEVDFFVGVDIHTNERTKFFKIHHSKSRTHIVPYSWKKGDNS